MSKFLCEKAKEIKSYIPGEQPQGRSFIKLNTNESPFGVPESIENEIIEQIRSLQLYSDPETYALNTALASYHNVGSDNIITTNGSDEGLAFIALAFCRDKRVKFPDVTYGFYSSICHLYNIGYELAELNGDFTVDLSKFDGADVVFLANPNAQTGIAVGFDELATFIKADTDRLVVVDEAYVDFGGRSVLPLTCECDNLIVVRTMSKSRSLAGGRLGYVVACSELVAELKAVKYSFNPYSVNRMTMAAGIGAIKNIKYFDECSQNIVSLRESVTVKLVSRGFVVLPSSANFILTKSNKASGAELKASLQDMGILVRHFDSPKLCDYIRVTIGSETEMRTFIQCIDKILEKA